jgi:hypothetical protein
MCMANFNLLFQMTGATGPAKINAHLNRNRIQKAQKINPAPLVFLNQLG